MGDPARPTDRTKDSPKGRQPVCWSQTSAWAPTHTLTNPFTEVVDHSAATSILAAGTKGEVGLPGIPCQRIEHLSFMAAAVRVGSNGATQTKAKCCRDVVPLQFGRLYFSEDRSASIATEGRLRPTKQVRRHRPSPTMELAYKRGPHGRDPRWRYSPLTNWSMRRRWAVADGGVDARRYPHIAGILNSPRATAHLVRT